jgi:carbonic anhydrase/acetyltransferase-like protein (isoleucine patch superfamily)
MGSPARVVRSLTLDEQKQNLALADQYVRLSRLYLAQGIGIPV